MIFRKKKTIDSKYNENEYFSFDNVPQTFKSVTEKSINMTRYYCVKSIADFDARQIVDNLESIDGKFGHLYKKLQGDYETRKAKLNSAYNEGLSAIEEEFRGFPMAVEKHNKFFKEYSRAYEAIYGEPLDESCKFPKEKLDSYKRRIKALNTKGEK